MTGHEPFGFHSLDELRARIGGLGVDLQVSEDVSPLLEPLDIGGFGLANRLVTLPMEGCDGSPDGSPDELTFRRYRRFAAGGAGLLWFEATAVVEEGRANPRQLWIREDTVDGFARLVEASLKAAPHRPYLVLQLTHSGRYSKPGRAPQPIIAHHSPFLDPLHNLPPDYPVVSDDELERLEDRYVEAARLAQRAGFDAVDVKACHRYLVSELHASHTREGRYGGSFENRSRFFRNVVAKIRALVPGIAVTSRMNAYDAMEYPYGFGVDREDPAKPDLSEPMELVRCLKQAGAPLVNITIGNPYFNPHVNRPFDLPVAGAPVPAESPLYGRGALRGHRALDPEGVPGNGGDRRRLFLVAAVLPERGGGRGAQRMGVAGGLRADGVRLPGFPARAGRKGTAGPRAGLRGLLGLHPDHARRRPQRLRAARRGGLRTDLQSGTRRGPGIDSRDGPDLPPVQRSDLRHRLPRPGEHPRVRGAHCIRPLPRGLRDAAGPERAGGGLRVCVPGGNAVRARLHQPALYRERSDSPLAALGGAQGDRGRLDGRAAPRGPASGKRVAVLGAGPAGISAAVALASLGHEVSLLDRDAALGGQAQDTIPAERLPVEVLHREIRDVLEGSGVKEHRRFVRIHRGYNLDHVLAEGFDAVLIALGLSQSVPLPGSERPQSGVVSALDFLTRAKDGAAVSGTVLVLGGGNTAIDAALSARRAGASDVAIVYRRSFAEMPAWPEGRGRAIEAGVHFLILTAPLAYVADRDGKLAGLRVVRTRLTVPGADGRRRPENIPVSEHVIPADLVIEAMGQQIDDELAEALAGVEVSTDGLIRTRQGTLETSRPGVFAAGDIVNGGATVVQAVAEGARAAREIDGFLRAH